MSKRTASIIGGIGRTFISAGLLILAFAGFQLWGTGIAEGRAQDGLADDFKELQSAYAAATTSVSGAASGEVAAPSEEDAPAVLPSTDDALPSSDFIPEPPKVAPRVPDDLLPRQGDPLGVIKIPTIDVEKVIIQGVARDDLRKGPGHYAQTVLPGQAGNAAVAGHRTTYGAPFGDIDLLEPGDTIQVETFQGSFTYEVIPQEQADGSTLGHSIVTPFDVHVIDDYGDNRLTLTACHPKYSARQRIIVQAQLVSEPAPVVDLPDVPRLDPEAINDELAQEHLTEDGQPFDPTVCADCEATGGGGVDEGNAMTADEGSLDESLGWHMEELDRVLLWGAATALVALLAFLVGSRWRRLPAYGLASPAFLLTLFFCFTHLDRMLPAF